MTPRLVPPDPRFTTESERVVWDRLRDTLSPTATLIANLRLTDVHAPTASPRTSPSSCA